MKIGINTVTKNKIGSSRASPETGAKTAILVTAENKIGSSQASPETGTKRANNFCDQLALRRLLPKHGGKIADVCGGYGRLANEYIGKYAEAFLFDYAPKLLEQAKAEYGDKLQIVQGTVYAMPFEADEFDAVIMIRSAHHLTDLNAAVAELARILKTGGIAVIEIANKRNIFEVARYLIGHSTLRPFSLEPERRNMAGFYCFHPRYVESIFRQNGLRVKRTLGWLKWGTSIYYLLVK
ncbi:class I SAM-dependent methyltransferase [Treponema sp. R80B11-R83G3]